MKKLLHSVFIGDTVIFSVNRHPLLSDERFRGIIASVSIPMTSKILAMKGLVLFKRDNLPYVASQEVITDVRHCRMVLTEKVIKVVKDRDYVKSINSHMVVDNLLEELDNL